MLILELSAGLWLTSTQCRKLPEVGGWAGTGGTGGNVAFNRHRAIGAPWTYRFLPSMRPAPAIDAFCADVLVVPAH